MIVLSQLRRVDDDREPVLYDLKETGSIENDADVVLFLHKDEKGDRWAFVAKNKNGPAGKKKRIHYRPEIYRFENYDSDEVSVSSYYDKLNFA